MSSLHKFTVGLVQMSMSEHAKDNLDKGIAKIEEAAKKGANVICLPELFRSQYFCQSEDAGFFDLAEPVPGPTTDAISATAKKLGVVVVAPVFERRAAGIYHNSAAIIDADGSMAGFYRKMHIPDDPSYYEKFYFTPGDLGFQAVNTKFGKLSTLICWDQWYPEGARLSSLLGASVLFYPTAIGWHPSEKAKYGKAQRESWQTIQRSHAIANGVYVVVANRTGLEKILPGTDGIQFWGSSFIADPQGVIIAEASVEKEETLIAEIDLHHLETIRRNWPFLRDRRIDAYHDITLRFIDTSKK
ncbi:MAG: carbon-nitrogen hydrolase [Ignavibacteriae bacterium]|nr:carbon-nitrogen hydrolase [Ignavibacteriota bacterium]